MAQVVQQQQKAGVINLILDQLQHHEQVEETESSGTFKITVTIITAITFATYYLAIIDRIITEAFTVIISFR